jgi:hypothetical protein
MALRSRSAGFVACRHRCADHRCYEQRRSLSVTRDHWRHLLRSTLQFRWTNMIIQERASAICVGQHDTNNI